MGVRRLPGNLWSSYSWVCDGEQWQSLSQTRQRIRSDIQGHLLTSTACCGCGNRYTEGGKKTQALIPKPEAAGGHVRGTADGSWLQGVKPPGSESLMDGFQIGKAPRPQTAECCFLLLCLYMFPLPSFSSIWHGVNGCEEISTACNVACLSHRSILFY